MKESTDSSTTLEDDDVKGNFFFFFGEFCWKGTKQGILCRVQVIYYYYLSETKSPMLSVADGDGCVGGCGSGGDGN